MTEDLHGIPDRMKLVIDQMRFLADEISECESLGDYSEPLTIHAYGIRLKAMALESWLTAYDQSRGIDRYGSKASELKEVVDDEDED